MGLFQIELFGISREGHEWVLRISEQELVSDSCYVKHHVIDLNIYIYTLVEDFRLAI